jgi:transposase InsO family protein
LITVDYLNNFWEVDRMTNTTSEATILKMKSHFARCGIPDKVVSDNRPQYDSEAFRKFAQEWDFKHELVSPHHSQTNGKIEATVKSVKNLIRKAIRSGLIHI